MADQGAAAVIGDPVSGSFAVASRLTGTAFGSARTVAEPIGGAFTKMPAATKALGRAIPPSATPRPLTWDGDSWVDAT